MRKILKDILILVLCLCSFGLTACDKDKVPDEVEFRLVMDCVNILENKIRSTNAESNIFGDNYEFVISGKCLYTELTASYRIKIPYTIKNTGGNDLVDIAYFMGGRYIGTEIDYDYAIYKTWDEQRQALFALARLDYYPDKEYDSNIVMKALND